MYIELREALDELAARLQAGEDVDSMASNDLMSRLRESVPSMKPREVAELHERLQRVMGIAASRRDQIDLELGQIQKSRKALNGYDHLADNHTAQRLYRRA